MPLHTELSRASLSLPRLLCHLSVLLPLSSLLASEGALQVRATLTDEVGLLQYTKAGVKVPEGNPGDSDGATPWQVHAALESLVDSVHGPLKKNGKDGRQHQGGGQRVRCTFDQPSDCGIKALSAGSVAVLIPSERWGTGCLDGSSYAFQVFPGEEDKLLVYFQAGGACWDPLSTVIEHNGRIGACRQYVYEQLEEGIFDRTNADNPYRDYTIVHVNYCSGDAHAGNAEHQWGRQAGYNNSLAAISWAMNNMRSALDYFAIAGSSGGSLGAQVWARTLLNKFDYRSASLLADSYLGVFPPDTQGHVLSHVFRFCDTPLSRGWKEKCGGGLRLHHMVSETMDLFKQVPFLFIQSKADAVQIEFYNALHFTLLQEVVQLTGEEFYQKANAIYSEYDTHSNFLVFQVDGEHHVFLPEPPCQQPTQDECKGNIFSASPQGPLSALLAGSTPVLADWIWAALDREGAHVRSCCAGVNAPFSPTTPLPVNSCAESLNHNAWPAIF